jgi:hypothetical protein
MALLWCGTADSVVVLHPIGFRQSAVRDVWGNYQVGVFDTTQVGFASISAGVESESHALMWRGNADSVVDLHPIGYSDSSARDVWENTQVGWGISTADLNLHALLWNGDADTVVDLHPIGFKHSVARAVAGPWQVGEGSGDTTEHREHALVWDGTAGSVHDLHQYLVGLGPAFHSSLANGVDINGNIVGTAIAPNGIFAVKWSLIPEPSASMLGCLGLIAARLMRVRKTSRLLSQSTSG